MKTYSPKLSEIERRWHVIDAAGQPLGRLAVQVATLLRGKHKVMFTPHLDTGDYVIIVNASKVMVTGNKTAQKTYYHHSMYPGGLKTTSFLKLQQTHPERVIEHAVKGMLPHGPLGSAMLRKLKVYAGATHPHRAQVEVREKKPQPAPEPQKTQEE